MLLHDKTSANDSAQPSVSGTLVGAALTEIDSDLVACKIGHLPGAQLGCLTVHFRKWTKCES